MFYDSKLSRRPLEHRHVKQRQGRCQTRKRVRRSEHRNEAQTDYSRRIVLLPLARSNINVGSRRLLEREGGVERACAAERRNDGEHSPLSKILVHDCSESWANLTISLIKLICGWGRGERGLWIRVGVIVNDVPQRQGRRKR